MNHQRLETLVFYIQDNMQYHLPGHINQQLKDAGYTDEDVRMAWQKIYANPLNRTRDPRSFILALVGSVALQLVFTVLFLRMDTPLPPSHYIATVNSCLYPLPPLLAFTASLVSFPISVPLALGLFLSAPIGFFAIMLLFYLPTFG